MIRLWNRVGAFRMLAAFVLVLGVVAGVFLGAARQTQARMSMSGQVAQSEVDELRQLRQDSADRQRASAASRAAQREAQAKADEAAAAAAAQARAAEALAQRSQSGATTRPPAFGPIPTSCSAYRGNQAIGCTLMLQWGFGLDQMPCLQAMWMKESGWNELAVNRSSGAYGIPQALPASKMSVYGADYRTNPVPQIKWGLDYIKNRYRTPCGAWSYWQAHHWY